MADENVNENVNNEIEISVKQTPEEENLTTEVATGPMGPEVMEDSTAPEQQSDGLPPETDNLDEDEGLIEQDAGETSGKLGPGTIRRQQSSGESKKTPVWPIDGIGVSDFYSKTHGGVDFGTGGKTGVPVRAYRAGVVADVVDPPRGKGSGYDRYGKVVVIKHSKNKYSLYAHLDSIVKGLEKGDKVKAGQQIGVAGKTGDTNRIHLHFELRPAPGIGNVPIEKRINPFTKNKNSAKYLK